MKGQRQFEADVIHASPSHESAGNNKSGISKPALAEAFARGTARTPGFGGEGGGGGGKHTRARRLIQLSPILIVRAHTPLVYIDVANNQRSKYVRTLRKERTGWGRVGGGGVVECRGNNAPAYKRDI